MPLFFNISPKFIAKEWREVIRHFELEEIPIRVRHPESNSGIECYHRSVPEEALLAERKRKLKTAATIRKEVNRLVDLTKTKVGVYHFSRVDLSEND